jgi:hypothetical protein
VEDKRVNSQLLGNWADDPCYYVSVRDGAKFALVAGPFRTHEAALAAVKLVTHVGCDADPWGQFYAWGTCRAENGYAEGSLNRKLHLRHPEIDRGEWIAKSE